MQNVNTDLTTALHALHAAPASYDIAEERAAVGRRLLIEAARRERRLARRAERRAALMRMLEVLARQDAEDEAILALVRQDAPSDRRANEVRRVETERARWLAEGAAARARREAEATPERKRSGSKHPGRPAGRRPMRGNWLPAAKWAVETEIERVSAAITAAVGDDEEVVRLKAHRATLRAPERAPFSRVARRAKRATVEAIVVSLAEVRAGQVPVPTPPKARGDRSQARNLAPKARRAPRPRPEAPGAPMLTAARPRFERAGARLTIAARSGAIETTRREALMTVLRGEELRRAAQREIAGGYRALALLEKERQAALAEMTEARDDANREAWRQAEQKFLDETSDLAWLVETGSLTPLQADRLAETSIERPTEPALTPRLEAAEARLQRVLWEIGVTRLDLEKHVATARAALMFTSVARTAAVNAKARAERRRIMAELTHERDEYLAGYGIGVRRPYWVGDQRGRVAA